MNMPSAPTQPANNSRATTALVLGIVGIVCCQLCGPFAWWMDKQELDAVKAGTSAPANEGMAKAGMILGIVGTILLGLSCVWMLFGGLAAVMSAMHH